MPITPQQARAELARRELARRGVSLEQPQQPIQEQPMQQPIQEQPQEPFYKRMMQPSLFGPLGQLYQGIPESIRTKLQETGLFGPLGTKMGQKVIAAPYKIAKGITGFAQEQAKKIPKVKQAYQSPFALGLYGPLGIGAGYLMKPEQREKVATSTISELGGLYGGGKIYQGLFNFVSKFKNWLKPKNQLALADKARNSLIGQKNQMVEGFGKQYQDIMKEAEGKTISLQEPFRGLLENTDDVINTIQGQKEFNESLTKNIPSAKKLLNLIKSFKENPNIPINISVEEADALQKFIKQMPSIQGKLQRAYKYGFEQVDWTNSERILLDFANDIKAGILDLAPELRILNQNYGQFMTNFKQIRPYLKWNNAVTNMKNIHRLDPAILDKLQKTLPPNIIRNILQMNRTVRNAELLKRMGIRIGEGVAIGATGYGVYRGMRR